MDDHAARFWCETCRDDQRKNSGLRLRWGGRGREEVFVRGGEADLETWNDDADRSTDVKAPGRRTSGQRDAQRETSGIDTQTQLFLATRERLVVAIHASHDHGAV